MEILENDGEIWNVALPIPLRGLYSYRLKKEYAVKALPGMRVMVKVRGRSAVGYLIKKADPDKEYPYKIKNIDALIDSESLFPDELFNFLIKAAEYYMHPIEDVLKGALPPGIDPGFVNGKIIPPKIKVKLEKSFTANKIDKDKLTLMEKRSKKRFEIFNYIQDNSPARESILKLEFKNPSSLIKRLLEDNAINADEVPVVLDTIYTQTVLRDKSPELNDEQLTGVNEICESIQKGYKGFLIHGITGSGKTEVYLHAVKRALEFDLGVIVLVPEITLTPQLVGRYRARFGDRVAVIHSQLTQTARFNQWQLLKDGKINVAIGVRSALFAPVKNLGLIIIDEEHDSSFKQEKGFPYNARDMSLLRAKLAGAVAVAGSATPSLESYNNALTGKLRLLNLKQRATEGVLPEVELINLANNRTGPHGQSIISFSLYKEIVKTLEKKEQVILFLNRRGFAPNLVCKNCGYVEMCKECSVSMTLHKRPSLLTCHYCGYKKSPPRICPECGSKDMEDTGTGTQKVEELLQELFTDAKIARLDRDTGTGRKTEQILEDVRDGKVDILVGTQMITKGHDFKGVSLVGVLQSDVGLHMPDFRASERTFQLLTQVAGRAGRGDIKGRALIQTYSPTHQAVAAAKDHNYINFANQELVFRKELGYPPFGKLAVIRLNSKHSDKVEFASNDLKDKIMEILHNNKELPIWILGPSPSPLEFIQSRFRWQIFLKSPSYLSLKQFLEKIVPLIENPPSEVRIRLDIDPVSML
ncbi:MAG: primosomal protein N' [Deltaproteobacteria bacterium]|nr:primosomal protein N' [Deltaproteobacteria bacterium]